MTRALILVVQEDGWTLIGAGRPAFFPGTPAGEADLSGTLKPLKGRRCVVLTAGGATTFHLLPRPAGSGIVHAWRVWRSTRSPQLYWQAFPQRHTLDTPDTGASWAVWQAAVPPTLLQCLDQTGIRLAGVVPLALVLAGATSEATEGATLLAAHDGRHTLWQVVRYRQAILLVRETACPVDGVAAPLAETQRYVHRYPGVTPVIVAESAINADAWAERLTAQVSSLPLSRLALLPPRAPVVLFAPVRRRITLALVGSLFLLLGVMGQAAGTSWRLRAEERSLNQQVQALVAQQRMEEARLPVSLQGKPRRQDAVLENRQVDSRRFPAAQLRTLLQTLTEQGVFLNRLSYAPTEPQGFSLEVQAVPVAARPVIETVQAALDLVVPGIQVVVDETPVSSHWQSVSGKLDDSHSATPLAPEAPPLTVTLQGRWPVP